MNWINLKDRKPKSNIDIEFIDSDGEKGYAYLCKCGNEWRCPITGGSKLVDVVKWRYDVNKKDFGSKVLEKVLERFEKMSIEEYEELYEQVKQSPLPPARKDNHNNLEDWTLIDIKDFGSYMPKKERF